MQVDAQVCVCVQSGRVQKPRCTRSLAVAGWLIEQRGIRELALYQRNGACARSPKLMLASNSGLRFVQIRARALVFWKGGPKMFRCGFVLLTDMFLVLLKYFGGQLTAVMVALFQPNAEFRLEHWTITRKQMENCGQMTGEFQQEIRCNNRGHGLSSATGRTAEFM